MDRSQHASKSNALQDPAARGKRKGKGGGGKKPIKVVYVGNPMRVTTSAAGFRALVQELTARHADPSKYGGGSAIDVDAAEDGSSGGSQAEPQGAVPSPVSTEGSSDVASAAGHAPAPAWEYDDEEDYAPQLIDNSYYSVFSPPTFLYGYGPHN